LEPLAATARTAEQRLRPAMQLRRASAACNAFHVRPARDCAHQAVAIADPSLMKNSPENRHHPALRPKRVAELMPVAEEADLTSS
jgi:hypothetical protein